MLQRVALHFLAAGFDRLPPKRSGFDSRLGHFRIVVVGNCARGCHWLVGFLGELPFPPPLHSSTTPYSHCFTLIVLKSPMLTAAQTLPTLLSYPHTSEKQVHLGRLLHRINLPVTPDLGIRHWSRHWLQPIRTQGSALATAGQQLVARTLPLPLSGLQKLCCTSTSPTFHSRQHRQAPGCQSTNNHCFQQPQNLRTTGAQRVILTPTTIMAIQTQEDLDLGHVLTCTYGPSLTHSDFVLKFRNVRANADRRERAHPDRLLMTSSGNFSTCLLVSIGARSHIPEYSSRYTAMASIILRREELREVWWFVTTKVLRANEGEIWQIWSSIEMQGWRLESIVKPPISSGFTYVTTCHLLYTPNSMDLLLSLQKQLSLVEGKKNKAGDKMAAWSLATLHEHYIAELS
ncbi:hypothetical protein PR048_015510 [Dryococelus australis]|uniref:Uncharacterized protein n=1 Tax=Dryococelus australis TaxID=614101 RepID=A0ABQ9HHN4_9NEOP|nr:hypothetical protein PR048_015510 [Dryococelus australis]